jgi:uracil-DNA glycosylase
MESNQRYLQLEAIAATLHTLENAPLYSYRIEQGYHPVIGEGNPYAPIMLVGEAPGEWEAKSGRPFVGAAGRLLNELLASVELARGDVYITNIVKDRPPENRPPTREEIAFYAPFLTQQIDIIAPKVIVTLGRFAMEYLLDYFDLPEKGDKISRLHGRVLRTQGNKAPEALVPLYHPAVALYNTSQKQTLMADFQSLRPFATGPEQD